MKHALTTLLVPRSLTRTTTLAVGRIPAMSHGWSPAQFGSSAIQGGIFLAGTLSKVRHVSQYKHHRQNVIRETSGFDNFPCFVCDLGRYKATLLSEIPSRGFSSVEHLSRSFVP
jgi:hypothetical protein